jgi:hypothetical protein
LRSERDRLHANPRLHRLLVQRPQQQPNDDAEQNQHPAVGEFQPLVHPQQNVRHEDGDGLDDRPENPTVRIGVIETVPNARELAVLERAGIDLIPKPTGGRDRHRDRHIGARCRLAGANAADGDRAPNAGCPSSNASAAVTKYFDFTPTPRRTVEEGAPRLELGEIGPLRLRGFRHHGVVAIVVHRILLGGTQSVR